MLMSDAMWKNIVLISGNSMGYILCNLSSVTVQRGGRFKALPFHCCGQFAGVATATARFLRTMGHSQG